MRWRYPDSNQLPLRITGPSEIALTAIFCMYGTTFRRSLGNSKYFKKSRARPQKHPAVCERLWRSMDKEALFFVSLSWNYVVSSTYRGRHRTLSEVLGNWDRSPPHSVSNRLFLPRKYILIPFEVPKQGQIRIWISPNISGRTPMEGSASLRSESRPRLWGLFSNLL
jgi:hypothetical protein